MNTFQKQTIRTANTIRMNGAIKELKVRHARLGLDRETTEKAIEIIKHNHRDGE